MTARRLPTTGEISEALVLAAEKNARSMPCELEFAAKVRSNPKVMEARLGRIRYVCGLLRVGPGHVLLDVGAGIGLNSTLALLCGAAEVHAVEYDSTRFDTAKLLTKFLGLEDRVHVHEADVLELELPPGIIDAAFSFELLEHIRDTARLYENLARWLRAGGRVYARTGANGFNVVNRRFFRKKWDRIDRNSYCPIRERVIKEIAPDVPPDALQVLVSRTRGELIDAVKRVALEYRRNRTMPQEKQPCAPRDPLTGEYMERLLDPYANIDVMDAQGFKTSLVRPSFDNITTVNPLLAAAQKAAGTFIRASHPASLFVAPWLEFLSERSAPNGSS